MEVILGKRLPITTLLQAPTIAQLAALLQKEKWSPVWSSLVAIQASGTKPPFFCVHGIGGTVLRFRDLARFVGRDQPFYGLQAQGLDGKRPPLTRVDEMAAHYINEILVLQPRGPYYIGGYSLGGMVAIEMAHQLRARGHAVGLVILLDTFPGELKSTGSLFRTYLTLSLDQQWTHLARKTSAFRRSLRRRVAMARLPAVLKKVRDACSSAARTYKPKPYDGPAVLFRASEKGLSSVSHESAWQDLAPQIEIYEVSGHHGNIVDEPQVRFLAGKLKASLEVAFQKQAEESGRQALTLPSAGVHEDQVEGV
jgi:thioesterase domain-containing protein